MGFGGGGSHLGTLFGDVSGFAAEQAEVLLETALPLCLRELAVFSELQGKVGVGLLLVSIATASISVTGVTGVARVTLSAVIFIFISVLSGVCFFIALPFIVRALILVGGQIFLDHLGAALPILGVDGLGEGSWRVSGLPTQVISSLMRDGSPQYICRQRVASPHWTQAARRLKSTRYFTMHWLSCILRFSRSASALPSGSWGPKLLFFNSPMKSE